MFPEKVSPGNSVLAWEPQQETRHKPDGAGEGPKEPSPHQPERPAPKNQEPACGGKPGVYISKREENRAHKRADLRDVKPEDLRDPARLLELHRQAVAAGYVSSSEADRLSVFAAAIHALAVGAKNPPGLFVKLVRSRLFGVLTQDDEDAARAQLRRALYPEVGFFESPRGEAPTPSPGLSDDARFVRDMTNVLRQRGIAESSVWRLVNREKPEWTRERWDAALAELRGETCPLAGTVALR